jgi:hypothetical protein
VASGDCREAVKQTTDIGLRLRLTPGFAGVTVNLVQAVTRSFLDQEGGHAALSFELRAMTASASSDW